MEQIEEHDRVEPAGHGNDDRLARHQHPVSVDGGSNPFQEHGFDCVDTNVRNQRLVGVPGGGILRAR